VYSVLTIDIWDIYLFYLLRGDGMVKQKLEFKYERKKRGKRRGAIDEAEGVSCHNDNTPCNG